MRPKGPILWLKATNPLYEAKMAPIVADGPQKTAGAHVPQRSYKTPLEDLACV